MRPRVQRASGIPCALFIFEGERFLANLGRIAPREREGVFTAVIVREGGRSSIPETLMIESKGRSVLDHPPSRVTTALCGMAPTTSLRERRSNPLLMPPDGLLRLRSQ
jgi:hypothetical protein